MLRVPWKSESTEAEPPEPPTDEEEPSGRPGWFRWLAAALVIVVLGGVGYFAYRQFFAPKTTVAAYQTFTVRKGNIVSTVAATGSVASKNVAALSFPSSSGTSSGTSSGSVLVTGVNVSVGSTVQQGQALATIDPSQLQLAVTEAQASLASAQATLTTDQAGPTSSDLASAQAAVANAQANLDSVKAPPSYASLSSAQQQVASAMGQVQNTRAALATLNAGPTSQQITNAQIAVNQAEISLSNAKLQQNTACTYIAPTTAGGGGGVATPAATPTPGPSFYNSCAAAKNSVTNASYQVTVAQNNLATLEKPATAAALAAAQQSVTAAENGYNAAVANYNTLKAGATQAQLTSAESQLASAQANLVKVQTPYTSAQIQSAQSAVDQAQAALDTAQANLDNATLRAPFSGVVSVVNVTVGQAPSSPAITIVDPSNLNLQTTVDEADISKINVGQTVTMTFAALPSDTFEGTVTSIAPTATIQSGIALYTVEVSINPTPISFSGTGAATGTGTGASSGTGATRTFTGTPGAFRRPGANATPSASATPKPSATPTASTASVATPLKVGMTGNASIVYSNVQNVLLVPNAAVKAVGREHVVELLVNGQPQPTTVTVGASNTQYTEVTSGLTEGDQVVLNATSAATTTTAGRAGGFGLGGGVRVAGGGFAGR